MSTQQPHILVADDEKSIRLMLETGLTLNGFRVTSVRTGREALEAASSGQFDAVLIDIYAVVELLRRYLDARREAAASGAPAESETQLDRAGLIGRSAPMIMVYK